MDLEIDEKGLQAAIGKILQDIRVELGDEFDKNFERQAFFNEAWTRRKSPIRGGGHLLLDSGALRRSVKGKVEGDSVTFYTELPYAGIHNDGGEIVVTAKMKKYFWAKYYEAVGGWGRKKNGEKRNDKKTRRLTTEAEFWKAMALMKVGRKVQIPRRRFLGYSPEVEKAATEIVERGLAEYFDKGLKG